MLPKLKEGTIGTNWDHHRIQEPSGLSSMAAYVRTILPSVRIATLFVFLLTFVIPIARILAQTASPQLSLDSVNVRQEGVVSYSTLSFGADPLSDFPSPRFLLGQTDDQSFRLYVDVDSIQQVRFNAFTFTAYLANAASTAKGSYKFQITGNPTGSFRDAPVRVSFHVKTGSNNIAGGILMPVYNATKTDLLVAEKQNEPTYVSVSGSTALQMRLSNVADTLPVAVTQVVVSEDCPKCWTRITSAVNEKSPLHIDPGTTSILPINLQPNSIPALLQGALVLKSEVPHDSLSITITYHTVPGEPTSNRRLLSQSALVPVYLGLGWHFVEASR